MEPQPGLTHKTLPCIFLQADVNFGGYIPQMVGPQLTEEENPEAPIGEELPTHQEHPLWTLHGEEMNVNDT